MANVRQEMDRHRVEMEKGTVQPRGPVLVEASRADAQPLLKRREDETPRPWTTQRIDSRALDESASKRIERMMALQNLVSDESQVFDIKKGGENDSPNICLGRARRNDVMIDADTISSQHAIIEEAGGRFILRDNSSSNGTFINQRTLDPSAQHILVSGDCIEFGDHGFYYLSGSQFALFLKLKLQTEAG